LLEEYTHIVLRVCGKEKQNHVQEYLMPQFVDKNSPEILQLHCNISYNYAGAMTSDQNLVAYPAKDQGLGEQVAKPSAGFCCFFVKPSLFKN